MDRHARDRQLQEYEDGLRELEEADRQRWEAYEAAKEAERAQCWDDWAMATEIGASSSGSTPRLRVIGQAHNSSGQVLERRAMQMSLAASYGEHSDDVYSGCAWSRC